MATASPWTLRKQEKGWDIIGPVETTGEGSGGHRVVAVVLGTDETAQENAELITRCVNLLRPKI